MWFCPVIYKLIHFKEYENPNCFESINPFLGTLIEKFRNIIWLPETPAHFILKKFDVHHPHALFIPHPNVLLLYLFQAIFCTKYKLSFNMEGLLDRVSRRAENSKTRNRAQLIAWKLFALWFPETLFFWTSFSFTAKRGSRKIFYCYKPLLNLAAN